MKVTCPHCSQNYNISEDLLGTQIECKACGKTIVFHAKDVKQDENQSNLSSTPDKPKLVTSNPASPKPNLSSNSALANQSLAQYSSKKSSSGVLVTLVLLMLVAGLGFFLFQKSNEQEVVANPEIEVKEESLPIKPDENKEQEPVAVVDAPEEPPRLSRRERRRARRAQNALVSGEFETEIVPILERTCMACHDELSEEGDLNLEQYLLTFGKRSLR